MTIITMVFAGRLLGFVYDVRIRIMQLRIPRRVSRCPRRYGHSLCHDAIDVRRRDVTAAKVPHFTIRFSFITIHLTFS